MNTSSFHFFLFVVAVLGFYVLFPKYQKIVLLLSSLLFIAYLDLRLIITVSILSAIVYLAGVIVVYARTTLVAKIIMGVAIALILLNLWLSKYIIFSSSIIERIFPSILFSSSQNLSFFLISLGISFFSFKLISTIVDIYRTKSPISLFSILIHTTFFPEFLAGPLSRNSKLLDQLHKPILIGSDNLSLGFRRIIQGLFKKLVIANGLAVYVNAVYAMPDAYSSWNVLLAMYLYAFQILFDFSGYTDIAIGVGQLFGIKIPDNFDLPYLATSIRTFWRRWHMTLSGWFRDYIYIPLGGSRKGLFRTIFNIMVVFFFTGIWHGASVNYIIWGLIHGSFIIFEMIVSILILKIAPHWRGVRFMPIFQWFITFNVVVFSWLFFRLSSPSAVLSVLTNVFEFQGTLSNIPIETIMIMCGYGVALLITTKVKHSTNPRVAKMLHLSGLFIACLLILFVSQSEQLDFIYFKF